MLYPKTFKSLAPPFYFKYGDIRNKELYND